MKKKIFKVFLYIVGGLFVILLVLAATLWIKSPGKADPITDANGKIISGTKNSFSEKPFDKQKEIQVGYYHIFAKDIDEATAIAKQNPEFEYGTGVCIEVRPIKTKEKTTGFVYPK